MSGGGNEGQNRATSRELLGVTGDGSARGVVERLLQQPPPRSQQPRTFKVARSPLFDQLQSFLPQLERSTHNLLAQPEERLHDLDIENVEDDTRVIEMNLMIGEGLDPETNDQPGMDSTDTDPSSSDDDQPAVSSQSSLRLTRERRGGQGRKNLIEEVEEDFAGEEQEGDVSDGEVTVDSISSGER